MLLLTYNFLPGKSSQNNGGACSLQEERTKPFGPRALWTCFKEIKINCARGAPSPERYMPFPAESVVPAKGAACLSYSSYLPIDAICKGSFYKDV
jgi:hypothetical protein